jgi:hypothetical protein
VADYISERFARPPLPCQGQLVIHAPVELVTRYSHPSTVVEPLSARRCRVTASSWSWTGLAAWAAMFDTELEIIGPAELRAAAAQLATRFSQATEAGPRAVS